MRCHSTRTKSEITLSRFAWRWGWLLAIFAVAGVLIWRGHRPPAAAYVTATAERGSVVQAVTATGTVNPVVTGSARVRLIPSQSG